MDEKRKHAIAIAFLKQRTKRGLPLGTTKDVEEIAKELGIPEEEVLAFCAGLKVEPSLMVTQFSGGGRGAPEIVSGTPESMRIVLLGDDESQTELFKGNKFSEENFRKEMKRHDRTSALV